ncbi:LysE family translocator [Iodobacter sp. HSC-16F04]|uniref:LysE family translocator n=1 Tax=Iodobacter violaceini TaxID=3044271 RepID=A0ABX0KLP8_9NEIS|nr:LysE family translocator [Iodobacter violacea]NHQ85151.1 LysE family translocator [Iodobacter violacea]
MSMTIWLTFIATTFFISATPGPNMLLMLSHGTRYGWQATLATMSGALAGLSLLFALSAFGMATILATSATLFLIFKLAGAVYLIYLGWQCFKAGNNLEMPNASADSAARRFRLGLTVALSNPKAILFAGAFLPQFINTAQPQAGQWAILLGSFFIIEAGWQVAYAAGGARLGNWLQGPNRIKRFNQGCGAAFFTVGGLLAAAQR